MTTDEFMDQNDLRKRVYELEERLAKAVTTFKTLQTMDNDMVCLSAWEIIENTLKEIE